jgi:transposase-like protein
MTLSILSPQERALLEEFASCTRKAKALRRAQALLWLDQGESLAAVATRLAVTRQTVYNWVKHFRARRPAALGERLADGLRSGRPPTVKARIDPVLEAVLVVLKYCVASRRLTIVVAEQSTEAFSPYYVPRLTTHCSRRRDESVVETLMITLGMIVGEVLVDHMIEGAFTQYNHLLQGLLLDGAHEPFAVGVQIRAPGGQDDRFHAARLQEPIERRRKFGVSITNQILLAEEKALKRVS